MADVEKVAQAIAESGFLLDRNLAARLEAVVKRSIEVAVRANVIRSPMTPPQELVGLQLRQADDIRWFEEQRRLITERFRKYLQAPQ